MQYNGSMHVLVVHILLACLSFMLLGVALVHATVLAWQERQLHTRHLSSWLQKLPPLETMERILFRLIGLAFIALSLVLVSSFYFFNDAFSVGMLSKTIPGMLAWSILALILVGRYRVGWRGHRVFYGTVAAAVLLLFTFFSRFFLNGF